MQYKIYIDLVQVTRSVEKENLHGWFQHCHHVLPVLPH